MVLTGNLDFTQLGIVGTWSLGGNIGFGWTVQRQN